MNNIIKREYKIFSYKGANYRICSDKFELVIEELKRLRAELEIYLETDELFLHSLTPVLCKPNAPFIAEIMAQAARLAGVGPMAAVAGAFAQLAAKKALANGAKETIIENGGDIYIYAQQPVIIGLYSGDKKLASRLAFKIMPEETPLAVCSSSSKLGHSLSFGKCDLATVFAKDAALADAMATAVCNSIKKEEDLTPILEKSINLSGLEGLLVIKNDKIGLIGKLPQILPHQDQEIFAKITRDPKAKYFCL